MRFIDYLTEAEVAFYGGIEIQGAVKPYKGKDLTNLVNMFKNTDAGDYKVGCRLYGRLRIGNTNITNLNGSPSYIGDRFTISQNKKLVTLEGGPVEVEEDYRMVGCVKLTSFKGIARKIGGDIYASQCTGIKTLKHLWNVDLGGEIMLGETNDELELAGKIMSSHLSKGHNNYMLVMREAREHGVEDYFK